MYREITCCRICGNRRLESILDLGDQYLTGVFPRTPEQPIGHGPIEVVKCHGLAGDGHCGLLQNRFAYARSDLYGGEYGYRSGLNRSMVEHLAGIVAQVRAAVELQPGDVVLDIGSNDGTLLSLYGDGGLDLVGIDPTADRFARYYPPHVRRVADFFSADGFKSLFGPRKAKIVTSIAMFYDLDEPMDFMRQIGDVLADDGVWCFEQAYLPAMLAGCAYDAACHEHLEHYALGPIQYMAGRTGMKILDVTFNDANGGSMAVIAAKESSSLTAHSAAIAKVLDEERRLDLDGSAPYERFRQKVFAHRRELPALLERLEAEGRRVVGYGASTKGNVVLQFCGIDRRLLPCIAEVNEQKFGCYTPGTLIPIVSESEARAMRPDYMLVLPWHFRRDILRREAAWLAAGGKFIFPLPEIEVVGR